VTLPSPDVPDVSAEQAVSFRVAAHGLDRRRRPLAVRTAVPDYPKGAALRALAARFVDVGPDTLTEGTLLRALSLRGTTHAFAAADAAVYTLGVLPTPDDESAAQAALGSSWPVVGSLGVSAVDALARVTAEVSDVMADGHARSRGAVSETLHGRLPQGWEPWCERCGAHHVPDLPFRLALVAAALHFPTDGPELAAGPRPDVAGHAEARAELVRRFLGAYAPASARAFGEWAGLGPAEADASFAALGDEIVAVRLDRRSAMALAVDRERLHEPVAVVGVRLVPAGDPFLHQRDRATLLPDPDHRRQLWRPAGAPGLVLIDGTPSGVWRHKQAKSHVAVTADLWTAAPNARLTSALTTEAAATLSTTPDEVEIHVNP